MWLVSEFKGDLGGIPFSGHGQVGYDPYKKKYVGTWIDSMNPTIFVMEGEYDAASKTMTMTGTSRDPQSGQEVKTKNVTHYKDDGTRVFEMHMPTSNGSGEWWKMMEIRYKRRT
jgi:hypothetical protein